ncbi:MAG: rhodanese-like domain-containing protein [Oscillospiraceae bacterium]
MDVRGADEYRQGHIPGSVNLPLSSLSGRKSIGVGKDSPCLLPQRSPEQPGGGHTPAHGL